MKLKPSESAALSRVLIHSQPTIINTTSQHYVFSYIQARTICWNKTSEQILASQVLEGYREGGIPPAPMSRRSVFRALRAFKLRGIAMDYENGETMLNLPYILAYYFLDFPALNENIDKFLSDINDKIKDDLLEKKIDAPKLYRLDVDLPEEPKQEIILPENVIPMKGRDKVGSQT